MSLRRTNPAMPTNPVPSRLKVPGSGTLSEESPLLNLTFPLPPGPNGLVPVKIAPPVVRLTSVGTPFRVPFALSANAKKPCVAVQLLPSACIVPANVNEPPVMLIEPPVTLWLEAGLPDSISEIDTGPLAEANPPPFMLIALTVEEIDTVVPEADMIPPPNWKSTLFAHAATGSANASIANKATRLILSFSETLSDLRVKLASRADVSRRK
jgi:hypothetical protein